MMEGLGYLRRYNSTTLDPLCDFYLKELGYGLNSNRSSVQLLIRIEEYNWPGVIWWLIGCSVENLFL